MLDEGAVPGSAHEWNARHTGTSAEFGPYDTSCAWVAVPVLEGRKRIVVADPASADWETTVEVRKGEVTDLGDIALVPAAGEFRVHVEDEQGRPLDLVFANFHARDPIEPDDGSHFGLWLGIGGQTAPGEIVLKPIPPYATRLKIDVGCRGFEEQTVTAEAAAPVRVVLRRAEGRGSIAGVVTDAAGNPIDGAMVLVKGARAGMMTDARGRFQYPGLPASLSSVEVFAWCAGFKPCRLEVPVGSRDVRAVLERGAPPYASSV